MDIRASLSISITELSRHFCADLGLRPESITTTIKPAQALRPPQRALALLSTSILTVGSLITSLDPQIFTLSQQCHPRTPPSSPPSSPEPSPAQPSTSPSSLSTPSRLVFSPPPASSPRAVSRVSTAVSAPRSSAQPPARLSSSAPTRPSRVLSASVSPMRASTDL